MTNQSTFDTQQLPDDQTFASQLLPSSQPTRVNYWMISTLILGAILIVGGIVAFKFNTNQIPVAVQEITSPAVVQNELFSDILKANCKENKIELKVLPFTLSESIINAYAIQESIKCFAAEENYIELHAPIKTGKISESNLIMYVFHKDSVYMGMGNPLESLSKYQSVTINDQTLSIKVEEPGPYGISTLGLWISLIAEKTDKQSGTIVRAINNLNLEDKYFVDLIKKYGEKMEDASSSPMYVIMDPGKKSQFIEEVMSIATTHELFKIQAQKVQTYLDGVSF